MAKPTVKESVSPEQKLLNEFLKLQFQVGDLLPATANVKFQDIHALIVVLIQKFKRTQDINTQNEILKIQSVIKNYQELPVFFWDRKMDNEHSPNDLMEQLLDLIHHELLEITQYIFQNDFDQLVMHGEFLQKKLKPLVFLKLGKNFLPINTLKSKYATENIYVLKFLQLNT